MSSARSQRPSSICGRLQHKPLEHLPSPHTFTNKPMGRASTLCEADDINLILSLTACRDASGCAPETCLVKNIQACNLPVRPQCRCVLSVLAIAGRGAP